MKGFNKYVWDYEASSNQNVYGLYQSHGALLVANSEASLKTLDIDIVGTGRDIRALQQ